MEEREIFALWKSYDKRLEETLIINQKNAEAITRIQAASLISSLKPMKIFALVVGIGWILLIDGLLVKLFAFVTPYLLVSAFIQVLLTKLALGLYIYQITLIYQVDSSGTILEVQEKIARLQSSSLWVARLLFLQLPVWTTFYWNDNMLRNSPPLLIGVQILATLGFTLLAFWLYSNITYENRDKKWFKLIFKGNEWTPILKAKELLEEIQEFKKAS